MDYDWNSSTEEAVLPLPDVAEIVDHVLSTVRGQDRLIVLAHDRADKREPVKALPDMIEVLQELGYRFAALTPEVPPIQFSE